MITASLNSLEELDKLEARKQKEHEEKTRREPQLPVSTNKILTSVDIP
jgi:hypothetical protein